MFCSQKGKIKGHNVIVRCLRLILMLGPDYVTTMSIFDAPSFAKENTTDKGMKHAETELSMIDWPGALITLIEIGIIEGSILSRVELNKLNSIELKRGT